MGAVLYSLCFALAGLGFYILSRNISGPEQVLSLLLTLVLIAVALGACVGFDTETVLAGTGWAPWLFAIAFGLLDFFTFLLIGELLGYVVFGKVGVGVAGIALTNKTSAPLAEGTTLIAAIAASAITVCANAFPYATLEHLGKRLLQEKWGQRYGGVAGGLPGAAHAALTGPDWSFAGTRATLAAVAAALRAAQHQASSAARLRLSTAAGPPPVSLRVEAIGADGHVAADYRGTVHMRAVPPAGVGLPPDFTFVAADNGSREVQVTFGGGGQYQLSAEDTLDQRITADTWVEIP